MNEVWVRVAEQSFPRPVVALDVSRAAEPLWPVLLSTVEGLAEVLPEPARPRVAFLGGREAYSLDEFLRSAAALHSSNRGRGRVLGPLLEAPDYRPRRVMVIAARPVWDLADWASAGPRVRVVRTDPTVSVAGGAVPETDLSDVASVARVVHPPVVHVRLGGRGTLPVAWDNPAYRFADGALVAEPGRGWGVTAGFACAGEARPGAVLVRDGEPPEPLAVEPAEPPPTDWVPVTTAEVATLDAWRGHRPAHCPACRSDHLPGGVECAGGGLILPSLGRFVGGGFVRVRVGTFRAAFQVPPRQTVLLADGGVVVGGGAPTVWRWDASVSAWTATAEPWGPFERVGPDDEFALALPVGSGGGP